MNFRTMNRNATPAATRRATADAVAGAGSCVSNHKGWPLPVRQHGELVQVDLAGRGLDRDVAVAPADLIGRRRQRQRDLFTELGH